jgi:hypothetical protein
MAQHNKPLLRLFIFLQEGLREFYPATAGLNTRNIVFSSPIFSVPLAKRVVNLLLNLETQGIVGG